MNHITHLLRRRAHRTGCRLGFSSPVDPQAEDLCAYRLGGWPELPEALRTAPVYRVMSVMTVRPVTRRWMQWQTGMDTHELGSLLQELNRQRVLKAERLAPAFDPRLQQAEAVLAD